MSEFKDKLRKLLNYSSKHYDANFTWNKPKGSCSSSNILRQKGQEWKQNGYDNRGVPALTSNRQAPYKPSRIFSIKQFHKENDHDKLTYLFRSCTVKDIHDTIQQPILISTIPMNEPESSMRTKAKMKRKMQWMNEMLQLNERSSNFVNSPIRGLSSESTLTDILTVSPFKAQGKGRRFNQKTLIPSCRTIDHNKCLNMNLRPSNHFNKKLPSVKNEDESVEDYRNEFIISKKKHLYC